MLGRHHAAAVTWYIQMDGFETERSSKSIELAIAILDSEYMDFIFRIDRSEEAMAHILGIHIDAPDPSADIPD